jgi:hypothetical protein
MFSYLFRQVVQEQTIYILISVEKIDPVSQGRSIKYTLVLIFDYEQVYQWSKLRRKWELIRTHEGPRQENVTDGHKGKGVVLEHLIFMMSWKNNVQFENNVL